MGDRAFSWSPGAYGIASFGDMPATVPVLLIGDLRQRMDQVEMAGEIIVKERRLGDHVRISRGTFAGYEAIFDTQLPGQKRAQVLLTFLERYPQRYQLNISDIEKVKKS